MIRDNNSLAKFSNENKKPTIWSKMGHYLWGSDPINCLSHCYFIKPESQAILRVIFAVYHVIVLVWTACAIGEPYWMLAYLTLWGFTICTLYFIFINFVKHSHHSKKRWKAVYVLGEIGATLEFLICPFFFAFLFPAFLKNNSDWSSILLQVCLHLFCPIFIWIETVTNAIAFPTRHIWFLAIIVVIYPINNFIWTKYIFDHPVYPIITWNNFMSYLYNILAMIMGVGGFYFGRFQYRKKRSRPFSKPGEKIEEDVLEGLINQ